LFPFNVLALPKRRENLGFRRAGVFLTFFGNGEKKNRGYAQAEMPRSETLIISVGQ